MVDWERARPAQSPAPQQTPTLVTEVQNTFNAIKGNITKSADQFPEDKYTWQPTPLVRSWARLIAHISDDNNGACAVLIGEQRPARLDSEDSPNSAANNMTKADLQKALSDSFNRCDKAFVVVTTENMMERNGSRSKIGNLIYSTSHINEHYGNLVTYMRLNNMVPPSPAGRVLVDPESFEVVLLETHLVAPFEFRRPAIRRHGPFITFGSAPKMKLEISDTTIQYEPVQFKDPEQRLLLPMRAASLTVIRGASVPAYRTTQTFTGYKRFITSVRIKSPE